MSNKTLKATIKLDTSQAERKLKTIVKSINKVHDAANNNSRVNQRLNNTLNKTADLTERVKRNMAWATTSSGKFNNNLLKSNSVLSGLVSKMKRLAGIYLGVMGGRALFTTVDNITASENRLNNVNSKISGDDPSDGYSKATIDMTTESMNKMYAASQRARTGYSEMMANVSKSMVLAGKAFGNNMDNAIAFQETMAKAYTVGGASAAEQASSMYQMIQALGSGILQGDELRSVREGAPLAYQAIEEFAQGVYNTEESLKELASQGKITSDIVVAAIANASDSINESFNASAMTWAQVWTYIKNVVTDSLRPIQDTLNEFLRSDAIQVLLVGIENVVRFLGAAINWALSLLSSFITWFVDNWYWIQWIVYAGLALILGLLIKVAGQAFVTGAIMFLSMLEAMSPIAWLILLLGALMAVFAYLGITVQEVVGFIVGIIAGAIAFICTLVYDLFALVINTIAGVLAWFGALCDNIVILSTNAWNSAKAAFWEWVQECLNGTGLVAKAVSKIAELFGLDSVSIDTRINSARSKIKNPVDMTDAFMNQFNNTLPLYNVLDVTKKQYQHGYNAGYNLTDSVMSWIGSKLSNLTNKFKDKYGSESIGALDPSVALNTTNPDSGALGNISDNTDKIADNMELAQEDLEYLRKLAQLEWKKEYTSNNINISMTNNNNVNSDSDLDGIVTKLTEKLYEELSTTASGVYA